MSGYLLNFEPYYGEKIKEDVRICDVYYLRRPTCANVLLTYNERSISILINELARYATGAPDHPMHEKEKTDTTKTRDFLMSEINGHAYVYN